MRHLLLSTGCGLILPILGGCAALGKLVESMDVAMPIHVPVAVGGGDDTISLWMSIGALGITATILGVSPARRTFRLAWGSWRGMCLRRSKKDHESCVKPSERDSSPS
jgi:hypothetical protein